MTTPRLISRTLHRRQGVNPVFPLRVVGLVSAMLLLSACDSASSRPCGKEMRALREREALRIHGLSENDALPETLLRFRGAMKCAEAGDVESLRVQAWLLQSRLDAHGNMEGRKAVAEIQQELGVDVESDGSFESAVRAASERLKGYATAMRAAAGTNPDALLRADLTALALNPDGSASFPRGTAALINHVNKVESCFTVVNHQDLPVGTAMVTLARAGAQVSLHGDQATFPISRGTPKLVRLCANGLLVTGDVVVITVAGEPAFRQTLAVTADDEIRGLLRQNLVDGDVVAKCALVNEQSAKVACALAEARRAP